MIYQKKSRLNNKLLCVSILIVLGLLIPTMTLAAKRNHRYHSRFARLTPTPIQAEVASIPTPSPEVTGNNLLKGQWNYLAGSLLSDKGLTISPTELAIVSQDGSDSVPNAPINLAGTYLKSISGDFSISATMFVPKNTTATMQLYGNPPIIADEFRIEKQSMQIAITYGEMKVQVWNGSNQRPSSTQTFSVPMDGTLILTVTRKADNTVLTVNDIVIGTVKTPTLYATGNIWLGFDSAVGDWVLTNLQAQAIGAGSFDIADGSEMKVTSHAALGLQALASKKRPGFLVGMALALGPAISDPEYAGVAFDKDMLGSMTPENDMKMINLQPQRNLYTFQKADALVKLARQNGITDIHGHALVFGEANPLWFNKLPVSTTAEKQEIEKVMVDHITSVVKHFGDNVTSWDVINEPIADYDDFDESAGKILRNHKWYQAMGSAYIIKAFAAAYAANPNVILSINEYGLEEDGERWDAFLSVLKQFKKDLAAHHIPLENISVGFQSHVYEEGDQIDADVLRNHIQTLAVLGFKAQVSEMDVYNDDGDSVQAQQYADVFNVCFTEKNCIAWRGWILSDRYDVWQEDGQIEYGEDGLFGTKMQPRPGFTSIQKILTTP